MFQQPRWSIWSVPSLLAGVIWIGQTSSFGFVTGAPLRILGATFLACGFSHLLWPGDDRISHTGALAGVLGPIVALPYLFAFGLGSFLVLSVAALGAGWCAARMAFQLEPHYEDVPVPQPTFPFIAKVAVDEAILGFEQFAAIGFALDGTLERVIDEVDQTHTLFEREGFLEKPANYHLAPPDLLDPEIRIEQVAGRSVEMLRFESGYAPAEGEPGRERWLGYEPCRDGRAVVLRHAGTPRPWLICTNGYRMGHARIDIEIFKRFHEKLGLNVLIPVLPLHGPRRVGFQSGTGFIGLDVVDTLHAEAQSVWDLRRLLSWVKRQDAPTVGAFGLSLGGYTTAVFASLADGLDCAIPGIPLTDIARMLGRHAAGHQMRYAESRGYDLDRVSEMLRVVSPLVLQPRVPLAGRMIFAATGDRLVAPDQARDLWRHWEKPEIVWYDGAHVTFRTERAVWSGVDRTLRDSGVAA